MQTNMAAWLKGRQENLVVGPSPYTHPKANEIVVRNRALAVNPVDWMKQRAGDFLFSFVKYPFVLGSDVAGEVVEVGTGTSRFKVGDRVLGHAIGMTKERNNPAEGAFQAYTVLLEHMASAIPDTMSYERACVLPLGLSTAACGLFESDQLALDLPSAITTQKGETLLIWGGSTSVGSNAIQLAVAAGYQVVTTASPSNFSYCRTLGAEAVFDYQSAAVQRDLTDFFHDRVLAGALAVGAGSAEACLDVVRKCNGKKFVSIVTFPVSFRDLPDHAGLPTILAHVFPQMLHGGLRILLKSRLRGIRTGIAFATSIVSTEVSRVIYRDFLPLALAQGRYQAAPEPHVVGTGLEHVQRGLELQRHGVSAQKIVIAV